MQSQVGEIYDGKVTGLTTFGAFVKLPNGETGMVHISEVASVYVKDIKDHLTEGQDVKVKVLAVNENNKISLSIKQAVPQTQAPQEFRHKRPQQRNGAPSHDSSPRGYSPKTAQQPSSLTFEDMMAKFKQESDEKMSDLKRSSDSRYSTPRRSNGNKQ